MGRKPSSVYLPLDVEFFDNDKILTVGEKPAWLYLTMCCRAKRLMSDGVLSTQQVARLNIAGWQRRLDALVAVGLVVPTDDDRWLIIGWLERNMSVQQIEDSRRRDRVRKDSARNPGGFQSDLKGSGSRRGREREVDVYVTETAPGRKALRVAP